MGLASVGIEKIHRPTPLGQFLTALFPFPGVGAGAGLEGKVYKVPGEAPGLPDDPPPRIGRGGGTERKSGHPLRREFRTTLPASSTSHKARWWCMALQAGGSAAPLLSESQHVPSTLQYFACILMRHQICRANIPWSLFFASEQSPGFPLHFITPRIEVLGFPLFRSLTDGHGRNFHWIRTTNCLFDFAPIVG